MKKRGISLLIVIIMLNTNIYGDLFSNNKKNISQPNIKVKNKIEVDDELEIYTEEKLSDYNWSLIGRPVFSKVDISSKKSNIKLTPDIAGEYILLLEIENKVIQNKIKVYPSTSFSNKELEDDIEKNISNGKKEKLNEKIELLEKNYPKSSNLFGYRLKLINSYNSEENYRNKFIEIEDLLEDYKLLYKNRLKYTKDLLQVVSEINILDEKIQKIVNKAKNNDIYMPELYKIYLKNNEIQKGIEVLEELYKKEQKLNLAKVLQSLYLNNNNLEEAKYYSKILEDNLTLAKLYIQLDEDSNLSDLKSKLNEEELTKVEELENRIEETKKERKYYQNGLDSLRDYRFDMAKLYYLKIIESSENSELIKNSLKDLGELYFLNQDYQKSLEYYLKYKEKYDVFKEPELKYNIARNYFHMEKYEKAEKNLEEILLYYPYTVWETKARIYISKIKNKS